MMTASTQELVRQGRDAFAIGQMAQAADVLARAVCRMASDAPARLEVLIALGSALARTGQLARADGVLTEAIGAAVATDTQCLEWHARVERAVWRLWSDPASESDARATAARALKVFESHRDARGLAKTWRLIFDVGHPEAEAPTFEEGQNALERALSYARVAGDRREEADVLWWVEVSFVFGPLHAEEGIRRTEEILAESRHDGTVKAGSLGVLGVLYAMRGRFAEARDHFARGIAILEELGITLRVVTRQHLLADIELLANDPAAAERAMRWTYGRELDMGEKADIPGTANRLADALYRQGRFEEAGRWTEIAGNRGKGIRALLAVRRGEFEAAESLAREVVATTTHSQNLNARATALLRLGEVLSMAGRSADAVLPANEAAQLYERKGNLVSAQGARTFLETVSG